MTIFLLFVFSAISLASSPVDPNSVLVIVQDNTGPETGTGSANAGQWVADHYMAARGIPAGNILHISTYVENGAGGSCSPGAANCDVHHVASINRPYQEYIDQIDTPLRAKLATNGLAASIRYIVPTYGVPITIQSLTIIGQPQSALSIDAFIAGMNQQPLGFFYPNPYFVHGTTAQPLHIDQFTSPHKLYLVSRLDGQTAVQAAALVDKAILAETQGINVRAGTSYFDWQGLGFADSGLTTLRTDFAMLDAYNVCVAQAKFSCSLNNQQTAGGMITSAPNTLFAVGWYNLGTSDVYTFINGAVASSLSSNNADYNHIRNVGGGSWSALFLSRGVTATWGVTAEPGVSSIHQEPNAVLKRMWTGYTFGEAAWSATPYVRWYHIMFGDPLYRPKFIGPMHAKGVTFNNGGTVLQ